MNYQKGKKKKNTILLIAAFVAMLITTVVYLVCFTGDNQGYRTVSVVEVSGTVSVVKDDVEYSAYPGMILQEGHEIVTAANSYVRLVLDDDKYVKLEPGSRLIFDTLGLFGSNKTQLSLERGSLTSELVKPLESDAQYVVVAPNAVLSVRGTFFRVDLGVAENGEITADVMTYGGSVASQRVMPDGEVVEEEVLIDAGFKTSINMDTEETVYVMQTVDGSVDTTGDGVPNIAPIIKSDIPDADMVDIYFSAENGHELFVTAEEVKEDIEVRGIDLEEQTSVYEMAEIIKQEVKEDNSAVTLAGAEVFADDSKPIAKAEEKSEEASEAAEGMASENKPTAVVSVLTDGDGQDKELHSHSYVRAVTQVATCEKEGVATYTCDCGESYTETIEKIDHVSVKGGTAASHTKCSTCGSVLSGNSAHSYTSTISKEATCVEDGEKLYSCACGYNYTETIEALGHTEVAGGTADCHSKCGVCGENMSGTHSYSGSVTTGATCTATGTRTYNCSCGHSYTESIAATGHSEVAGEFACQTVCSNCKKVLSASHNYTGAVTTEATCATAGVKTYTCVCGDSYTEEIEATGHNETTGGTIDCHSKCSVCKATIQGGSAHTYTETTTESTCTTSGVTTYSCACGYSYTKELDVLGHEYATEYTVDTEATCTTAGSRSRHCSRCESVADVTEIPATGHSYTDAVTKEATCTEKGVRTYTCHCNDSYTEEIEILSHTVTYGGEEESHTKCSVCGTVLTGEDAHEYVESTQEATCTEEGLKTYTCNCGYSYTEAIEATGHTKTDASASESICSSCGETLVDLNATNFPDATFLAYVGSFDTDGDGMLLGSELAAVTQIDVASAGITDLTGIEHFTEITLLKCSGNTNLTNVDVSALTKLETLNLTSCSSLSTLDITALTELVTLDVNGTALTSLDTRNNTKLEVLRANNATGISTFCGETGTLNFSYNTNLKEIQFNSNTKFTAIDLTQNAALETFIYNAMPMTTIDLTGCTSLSNFQIVSSNVTALDFSSCTNLTTMVATNCTALTSLNVSKCSITSLNIGGSTAIATLNISSTKIASLDLSGRTALTTLTASSCTSLTSLNVSDCTLLKTVNLASCTALSMDNVYLNGCSSLQSLNVDKCTKMTSLDFSNYTDLTALTSLTISNNGNLKTVDFSTLTALSSVSLANSGSMTDINISNTKLTGFDSSGMWSVVTFRAQNATKLQQIKLGNASTLTTLDVTGCTALTSIDLNESSALYSDTSQITGYTSSMGSIK